MALLFKKIASFFLPLIMLMGLYRGGIDMKNEIPVSELDISAEDITNGYTVTLPLSSGTMRFNRISFSYETTAAVRAIISYRMDMETFEEELLLSSKSSETSMLLNGYLCSILSGILEYTSTISGSRVSIIESIPASKKYLLTLSLS